MATKAGITAKHDRRLGKDVSFLGYVTYTEELFMSSLHRFNMLCQWTCIWCSCPVCQHQHLSSSTSTSIYKWLCTSVASVVMQRRRGERSSECAVANLSTACQNEQSASLSCEPCLAWCYIPCYVLQPCTLCPIRCVQILIHGARSGF